MNIRRNFIGIIILLVEVAVSSGQSPGTKLWDFYGGGEFRASPAVGPDGTIYIGTTTSLNGIGRTKLFYAINPNGSLKWSFETPGFPYSFGTACIGPAGTIYVPADRLYAFNSDGTMKWSIPGACGEIAIGTNGTIYGGGSAFCAFNPDGTIKWSYTNGWSFVTAPAISRDGTIYVAGNVGNGGKVYAFNPNGTLKWDFFTIDTFNASNPTVDANGTIYIGSEDKTLYALNPSGTLKWTFLAVGKWSGISTPIKTSPVIGNNGTIYIGCRNFFRLDDSIYAINPDGTYGWGLFLEGEVTSSPAVAQDGTMFFTSGYTLFALTPNGMTNWSFTKGGERGFGESSPAIAQDGTIYAASIDNFLYAIKGGSPLSSNSPWPKFGANLRNTSVQNPTVTRPVINRQPTNQTLIIGSTVTLSISATGDEPLTYYWRKGATVVFFGRDFTIASVQPSDAGTYSVIVSNTAGTATSSNAVITVISRPLLQGIRVLPDRTVEMELLAQAGRNYEILASGTLAAWAPLMSLMPTNDVTTIRDTSATGLQQRFYRVAIPW